MISWLLYTNLQNKTQFVGFFTRNYKTKKPIDGTLLLRDYKKVSISILFKKFFWVRNFLQQLIGGGKGKRGGGGGRGMGLE